MRLDLACGRKCAAGYEGVDKYLFEGVSYLCDLTKRPWRLHRSTEDTIGFIVGEDSVEALRVSHFVEHLHDLVGFMNECHRVLQPGSELQVICPYQFSVSAWQDPTHVRALNEVTFSYFDGQWRKEHDMEPYGEITADFEVKAVRPSNITMRYAGLPKEELDYAIATQVNVVHEITAILVKR